MAEQTQSKRGGSYQTRTAVRGPCWTRGKCLLSAKLYSSGIRKLLESISTNNMGSSRRSALVVQGYLFANNRKSSQQQLYIDSVHLKNDVSQHFSVGRVRSEQGTNQTNSNSTQYFPPSSVSHLTSALCAPRKVTHSQYQVPT